MRKYVPIALALLVVELAAGSALAQTPSPTFHFQSICRSDPATNKDTVRVVLHRDDHSPLAGVTVDVLWSYVDYRQNHAVFRYKQDSRTTGSDGSCTFNGGSGRARWQLSAVAGHSFTGVFDTLPTAACPNTLSIDFW